MSKAKQTFGSFFFFLSATLFVIIILSPGCKVNTDAEIAQWRGINRNGIYPDTNLLIKWPENGPELLWVYEGIGRGYASPSILNDRVFVNGEEEGNSFLYAFDLQGELIWKSPNGKEFVGDGFSATYPGSRSTPTVVENLVYTTSGMGRVACFDATTGEEKWAKDLIQDFDGLESYFGYSESVVVDDNKVYCFAGGSENNFLALNRLTGEIIWASVAMKDTFSYCSPIMVELPEQKILVTHSRHHLFAIDCQDGNVLGSYPLVGFEYDGEHCNSPVYDNGFIYFIGNDNEGCGAVKLKLEQENNEIREIWGNQKIKNNFHGFIKVENNLFTTVKGNWLKALDIESGEVTDSLKVATGSIIYADNKFICYGTNGDVNLISNSNKRLEIVSTFKVTHGTNHHFSYPVIADGIMYIRHGDALMAYKIV